jgi:hypothetical protein
MNTINKPTNKIFIITTSVISLVSIMSLWITFGADVFAKESKTSLVVAVITTIVLLIILGGSILLYQFLGKGMKSIAIPMLITCLVFLTLSIVTLMIGVGNIMFFLL